MALAEATVAVILDVSRFDRQLQQGAARGARNAGRTIERELQRAGSAAGRGYTAAFQQQFDRGLAGFGARVSQRLGSSLQGRQIGVRLGVEIGQGIGAGVGGVRVGARLRASIERDATPGVVAAARTVGSRFAGALGTALGGAASAGQGVVLGGALAGLVAQASQAAVALAPAAGAIGALPAVAAAAAAGVTTLKVAFAGYGDALKAAASGDAEELSKALQELAPNAAATVREFARFAPELRRVRTETQQAFFGPLVGDIDRLGQALLGPVRRGMTTSAAAAGRLASGLADVASGARNADLIERIFGAAARGFDRFAAPLERLTQGTADWIGATLPAVDRLGGAFARATDRLASFLSENAASGNALRWVDQALTTLRQLGDVAGSAFGVVRAVVSAANVQAGGYLERLNQALISTREFLSLGAGRSALLGIFEGVADLGAAAAGPLRELVVQLGQVAPVAGRVARALSGGLTDTIRGLGEGIRNAGPAIERFAEGASRLASTSLGPALSTAGAALGRMLDAVTPLLPVLGGIVRAGADLVDFLSRIPGPVLTAVAAFVALRALGVPTLLNAVGRAASTIGVGFRDAYTEAGTFQRTTQGLARGLGDTGAAAVASSGFIGGLGRTAAGAGGAFRAFGGLLLGAFGGPAGLAVTGAIAAVTAAIGLFGDAQAESAKATADQQRFVNDLARTFDASTGAITENTIAIIRNREEQSGNLEIARKLGINVGTYVDALAGQAGALEKTQTQLRAQARAAIENSQAFKDLGASGDLARHYLDLMTDAALGNSKAFDETFRDVGDFTDSQNSLARDAVKAAGDISKLDAAVRNAGGEMKTAQQRAEEYRAAVTKLNFSDTARQLRDVQSALATSSGEPVRIRVLTDDAQRALQTLGFEVRNLGGNAGFEVKANTSGALAAIKGLQVTVDETTGNLVIKADTDEARAKVAELSKVLTASATTKLKTDAGEAYATLDGFLVYVDNQTGRVTIRSKTDPAQQDIDALKGFAESIGIKVKIGADGKLAVDEADKIGKVIGGKQPTMNISSSGRLALDGANATASEISGIPADLNVGANATQAQLQAAAAAAAISGLPISMFISANTQPAVSDATIAAAAISGFPVSMFVGANTNPATTQAEGAKSYISRLDPRMVIGGDPFQAFLQANAAAANIARNTRADIQVGADTSSARRGILGLIGEFSGRAINVVVNALRGAFGFAGGGIYSDRGPVIPFRNGGINTAGLPRMSASRPAVVPPNSQRVIGDRVQNAEAFIPLIRSPRTQALAAVAGQRTGLFDRLDQRPQVINNYSIPKIEVTAPFADPGLVARRVVNELTNAALK